ncbi:hypothetical protein [Streptomyces sp. NPDC056982]|uniref:hypothetical protein n=1 Tax=Streptomyces sp. NPDC056982 TaxID=3345986 RepID=UPI00363A3630
MFDTDVKMTEEFVSAMVTVIPVILLVASVEYMTVVRDQRQRWMDYQEQLLEAIVNGAPEPRGPGKVARRAYAIAVRFWNMVLAAHIAVEANLVVWLAGTKRPTAPSIALIVEWVAIIGFVSIVVGGGLHAYMGLEERRRQEAALREKIRAARQARAEQPPTVRVPPPSPDLDGQPQP